MNKKLPYIEKGLDSEINFQRVAHDYSQPLLWFFFVCITIFFLILILRLFQLTVVKGSYYAALSDENRVREVVVEAERGQIIDRKGFIIAHNLSVDLNASGQRLFSRREYSNPEAFAHILGYRQLADDKDFQQDDCLNKLKLGDKVGKKGVEKLFECQLRGKYGKKLVEVDARGKTVRTLTVIPPENGKRLQLAVDSDLQKKAYEIIKDKKAVVVGIKPKTGEILILASSPSFNPQDFEDGNSAQISRYFKDSNKPMFNRATEGAYPPGSTFKLVLAAGSLQDGTISSTTTFDDKGYITAGPLKFGNWYYLEYGKVEGIVDITKAIRRSNDTFFYQVGAKMGPANIKSWAEKLGYNQATGIGIDESSGTIPSPFWKEDVLKEKWYLGDTYNLSIGQGYALATPLQVAQMTEAFANNGYLCKPKLLKINTTDNSIFYPYDQVECQKLPLSQSTLDLVKQGMIGACSPGGTGWPLFNFAVNDPLSSPSAELNGTSSAILSKHLKPIQTACKTGTAESNPGDSTPHAWFTVYAPANDPEIVLTVLVEQAGQGSDIAGPIAHDILKAYFERKE